MFRLIPCVFATVAFYACAAEIPAPVKPFAAEAARIFPEAKEYAEQQPGIYLVQDGNRKTLGTLFLETVDDDERQFGYAGPIEIAVLFDHDRRVAGVLIGKNQESPAFLNRIRAAKFLESWNRLKLEEIPGKEVDTVTGATYSSTAIRTGVRKLAQTRLKPGETKQTSAQPAGAADLTAAETASRNAEIIQLEQRIAILKRIVSGSQVLLKQLQERKEDELQLRLVAALEGKEAAEKFAREHKLMFFIHPGRDNRKTPVDLAAEKYRSSQSKADLEALKAAILANYERMLETVPPHNAEQEKALKAAEARLNMLKARSPGKAGAMEFSDHEAQALEDKINCLAAAFRRNRDPKLLEDLRREVARQLAALPSRIAEKERELSQLRKRLEEYTKDPDAVIRSRIEDLTR